MVDGVALRHHAHVADSVDVVVSSANTQSGLQDTVARELEFLRQNQLQALDGDLQATFVGERCDVDQGLFQGGLGQVGCRSQGVGQVGTSQSGVVGCAQSNTVATDRGGESAVQHSRSLDLLGLGHRAGQGLGVAGRQTVVEVVLNGFFGQRERQSDGLVGVASGVHLLCLVVSDASTFGLHRSLTKARLHHFLFKRTVRRFDGIDLGVLALVVFVLEAEQSIETRLKLFHQLCT